jgi:heterodisulfide reductase subunit C
MKKEPIDTRKVDPQFKFRIAQEEGGEGILRCFACGSCTVRCQEQEVKPEYNAREVIRKAVLGLKEEVYASEFLWICSSHYLCLNKCPQKINIKGVMNAVRNIRIEEETYNENPKPETRSPKLQVDQQLKYKVVEQECGQDIFHCFSCGTCTAGCPERSLEADYSPRKVIRKILLGMKDEVFANKFVNICSTHYRCLTQCPQDVQIPKLMAAIRRLAESEGYSKDGKKVESKAESIDEKASKKKADKPRVYFRKESAKKEEPTQDQEKTSPASAK